MIDVKLAVNSAYKYLQSMQDMMGGPLEDLRLEEVELSEHKDTWLVTLGYDVPVKRRSQLESMVAAAKVFNREYKVFRVNSETGEVEAMKIRSV